MSQESTQSRTLKKGFMLLEYEIIEVLGSGGFGEHTKRMINIYKRL